MSAESLRRGVDVLSPADVKSIDIRIFGIDGQVTTDDITPVDNVLDAPDQIGGSLLAGLNCEELVSQVTSGNCTVLVAGEFGFGSAREHSAYAMAVNGYEAVVADVLGPFFVSGLISQGIWPLKGISAFDRYMTGDMEVWQELTAHLSEQQIKVMEHGGLVGYMQALVLGIEQLPQKDLVGREVLPQTAIEKLVTRKAAINGISDYAARRGDSVVLRGDRFISYDVHWPYANQVLRDDFEGEVRVPEEYVALFIDHFGLSSDPRAIAAVSQVGEFWSKYPGSYRGTDGVYNKVLPRYMSPGEVVEVTDSHGLELAVVPGVLVNVDGFTGFGCALGADGMILGNVPETVRLEIVGQLPKNCDIKDAIWWMIDTYFEGSLGAGAAIEIAGQGYADLSYEEAAKVCNATTEMGARSVVVAVLNWQVIRYLREYGSGFDDVDDSDIELLFVQLQPDAEASYRGSLRVDLSEIEPRVMGPHTHKRAMTLDQAKELGIGRVMFDSCSGTSLGDLAILAAVLGDQKVELPVNVHLTDPVVRQRAEERGIIKSLVQSEVVVADEIGCGPCLGQGVAVQEGEVVLATANRNYPGRRGDPNAEVYLSSAVIAALTAKLGQIPTMEEVKSHGSVIDEAKLS